MQSWAVALLITIQAAPPVVAEFRVFDGPVDVTASARVRVRPAGQCDALVIDVQRPATPLPPGLYDVEAQRRDRQGVVIVKRLEGVPILHYPDEGGRHLQIVNLQPGFGALVLRTPDGPLQPRAVALFASGDRSTPAAEPVAGPDYLLFVVPAGRYDVRVQHAEHGGAADTHWMLGVEIAADATRLRLAAGG